MRLTVGRFVPDIAPGMNLALVFTIGICTTRNRFDVWAGFLLTKRSCKPTGVMGSGNGGARRAADTAD